MTNYNDGFDVSTIELAESAKINFENLVRTNPSLVRHPFWLIAMEQLVAVVARLEWEGKDE